MVTHFCLSEQVDSEGRTAVHYAAFFGKHRALKFLIEAASDWNPRYFQNVDLEKYTMSYFE